MHSKITVIHFLAHLTIFWKIVLNRVLEDFTKLSYYLHFFINKIVCLQWPKYKFSIILVIFKKITLDSLVPLILLKRTLNNVSQVFMIPLNINTSYQPYKYQNYIILNMSLN